MKYLPYYYEGTLYTPSGCGIENPAILITKSDIFCVYGDAEAVKKEFDRRCEAYSKIGFQEEIDDLVLIEFNKYGAFNTEDIAYIILRMMLYTATGFVKNFYNYLQSSPDALVSWIQSEKQRIPINVRGGVS